MDVDSNTTVCMGSCKPYPYLDALTSTVRDGVKRCISSADKGDISQRNSCVYSLNRVFGACMDNNTFVIYNLANPAAPVSVSTWFVRDALGAPVVAPSLSPFTACMDASGNFLIQDGNRFTYFESRTGSLEQTGDGNWRAVMVG